MNQLAGCHSFTCSKCQERNSFPAVVSMNARTDELQDDQLCSNIGKTGNTGNDRRSEKCQEICITLDKVTETAESSLCRVKEFMLRARL